MTTQFMKSILYFVKNPSKKIPALFELEEIVNADTKSGICDDILSSLNEYLDTCPGKSDIEEYNKQVRSLPFYAVFDGEKAVGFAALAPHNPYTAEILVLAVLEEVWRQGVGRILVSGCLDFCRENRMEFLTVKLPDETESEGHCKNVYSFYVNMGFRSIERLPMFWGEDNPCLLMAKRVIMKVREVNK